MSTKSNGGASSRNIRLIMGIIALLVGFAVGWFANNGSGDTTAPADVVQQQVQERSGSDQQTDTDDAQASMQTDASSSDGADAQQTEAGTQTTTSERGPTIDEDGWYTTKEEVALYIHTYGRLPGNFISKTKARDRGWVASEGNLDEVCPGMSIGGSRFYNDDGQLPDKKGRQWTECDINYHGGHRGAERIVFSNDGLIFYTADHYETFEQLY
ncbi:MAG: hypothetical protein IJ203_13990 [Atopobiaceae bacterium]|nr:hypothetical protein [Atopobiaceae bacterium]